MNEHELRQFLLNQDAELKDIVSKRDAGTQARLLALEQHAVSRGGGGGGGSSGITLNQSARLSPGMKTSQHSARVLVVPLDKFPSDH